MTTIFTIDNSIIVGIFAMLGYIGKLIYSVATKIALIELSIKTIQDRQIEIIDDLEQIKKEKK